ncbi:MAG: hypothetical protein ACRDXF_10695 [Acidimicrobiia bacterium]
MTNSSEVTSDGPTDQHDDSAKTQTPSPGRGFAWAVAAFAVVLATGGLYFAFNGDDGQVVDQTTVPTPTTVASSAPNATRLPERLQEPIGELGPGVYFLNTDGDSSATTHATFVIEGPGWRGSSEGVSKGALSLHLHQTDEPSAPGCGATNGMAAGSTAADLADGFAATDLTVREAPAPVSAFGHDGYHAVIEVPTGCAFAVGWQWNLFLRPGDVMEAWIFDIDGEIVLVEAMWRTESQDPSLAELRAIVDTLVLTP